jgi:hypothetical protein
MNHGGGDAMKRILFLAALVVFIGAAAEAHQPKHRPVGASFGVFYSSLGHHGEWIEVGTHVYAWRPYGVVVGWRPYTVGRWVWTSDGWYWVSDEPWGWATYHYGRWYYDDFYGWLWIPGYEWAPAWVEWRYGGPVIGWAPLPPYAVFRVSVGIYWTKHWVTPHHYWTFVDCRYVSHPKLHRYVYRPEYNTRYIGRTRSEGSIRYDSGRIVNRGPAPEYIERTGRTRVERAEIMRTTDRTEERVVRESGRSRVEVFTPDLSNDGREARPDRVRRGERETSLDLRVLEDRQPVERREEVRDRSVRGNERREDDQTIRRNDESRGRGNESRPSEGVTRERRPEGRQEQSVPERRRNDQQPATREQETRRAPESIDRSKRDEQRQESRPKIQREEQKRESATRGTTERGGKRER